jgi:hypothetical protein
VVRNIQIITRLYASRDDILNGFDIDCCCCGFDGEHALITPRAIAAITTRVNTVDLSIRGESYELRLLKYVERGFAIGVPRLVRTAIDREHLSFKFGEHPWWGGISIDSSEGWRRWTFATGLELLLMAEQLARGFEGDGEVPWPLPGRRRSAKVHHDDPNLKFQARGSPSTPLQGFNSCLLSSLPPPRTLELCMSKWVMLGCTPWLVRSCSRFRPCATITRPVETLVVTRSGLRPRTSMPLSTARASGLSSGWRATCLASHRAGRSGALQRCGAPSGSLLTLGASTKRSERWKRSKRKLKQPRSRSEKIGIGRTSWCRRGPRQRTVQRCNGPLRRRRQRRPRRRSSCSPL